MIQRTHIVPPLAAACCMGLLLAPWPDQAGTGFLAHSSHHPLPEAMWNPVALLGLVLHVALDRLTQIANDVALAIPLLSVAVKISTWPASRLADAWQREVQSARVRLAPKLAAIRARHRGAERAERVLALHRAEGIHPLFGLKSVLGLAVQVPVFLAAYHMLDAHLALQGAALLWMHDLSRADTLAWLVQVLPQIGPSVHVLPLLMTTASVVAATLHTGAGSAIPEPLRRSERRGLFAMAGVFLVLLYAFPAGLLLYWTTNNVLALGAALWVRLAAPSPWRQHDERGMARA